MHIIVHNSHDEMIRVPNRMMNSRMVLDIGGAEKGLDYFDS